MSHPLFPPPPDVADDDDRDISIIHGTRFENTGQEWCPRVFQAEELTSHDDVYQRFGGGAYELVAKTRSQKGLPGTISAKARFQLPGAQKCRLDGSPIAPPAAPAPAPGMGPVAGGAPNDLATMMFQGMLTMMQNNAQMQMQAMQNQTTLLTTVLGGSRNDTAAVVAAMASANQANMQAMMEFYKTQSTAATGSNPAELIGQGMELMQTALGAAEEKGGKNSGPTTELGALMEGALAFADREKPAPAPAPPANGTTSK